MTQDVLDRPRAQATPADEPWTSSLTARIALPAAGVITVIAAWWLAVKILDVQTIILPSPPEVLDGFTEYWDTLLKSAGHTAVSSLEGFALAGVVGIALGTAIAAWKPIELAFAPLLVALNAVPKVTLAPLLLVWFGYGRIPVLGMAFLVAFFPVVLSTATGLTSAPAELIELARSLDATRLQTFRSFRVPAAIPQIFVGLRVAMPLAVIGVSVGEMQFGQDDLGSFIVQTAGQSDTAAAFAGIILFALIGILAYYLVVLAEKFSIPWVKATTA